jgi:DNA-binding MarR family transcriptional regulator
MVELTDALRDVVLTLRRRSRSSPHESSTVALLAHLMTLEPLRAGELADRACLDPSTVSRHLRSLESDGYLVRTPDPEDRRATLVQVTDAGRQLVHSAREQSRSAIGDAVTDWSPEDLDTLTRLVRKLATDLETA